MSDRMRILNSIYGSGAEDGRLQRSRHGQLEFLTTMRLIHAAVPQKANILEIGAGTGRYSVALAKEGHTVTAVEPTAANFALLRQNAAGLDQLYTIQGDALNLGMLSDDAFDLTLLLGPMYHLYTEEDAHRAIREALRVTKNGGVVMAAFLSVHAILSDNYLQGNLREGLAENFTADNRVRHFAEQGFTGYDVAEFESLFTHHPVSHLVTAATDGTLELAEGRSDFFLSDADFSAYAEYHWQNCKKRELLGSSAHLLYIGKKTV